MRTTVAAVNKALREAYGLHESGTPNVKLWAGRGYYYFDSRLVLDIPSLYVYRIHEVSVQDVLDHVARALKETI